MALVAQRAVFGRAIPLLLVVSSLACSAADPKSESGAGRRVQLIVPLDSIALVEAGVIASGRLAQHFADGQGFSRFTLEARADWFTDSLVALLRADMNDPSGDLGYVNFDPFTGAQDDVPPVQLRRVRAGGDTAYAEFGQGIGSRRDDSGIVTLALVRSERRWQIADILHSDASLAAGLRAYRDTLALSRP